MRAIQLRALFILISLCIVGCTRAAAPRPDSSGAERESAYSPSLGTEWGERIDSRVRYVSFDREDESPDDVATIHYDDRSGIRELIGMRREDSHAFTMRNGDVEFGLIDEENMFRSPFLPGVERSGQYYVRGKRGDRYAIYLRNRSDDRIEAVLSVDGVDAMNGSPASFAHRGYIIEPGETLEVEGFRDSEDSVAAFRFADVKHSYVAEKGGDVGNVGVVGIAVFGERGNFRYARPPRLRSGANPFPGEFATAP